LRKEKMTMTLIIEYKYTDPEKSQERTIIRLNDVLSEEDGLAWLYQVAPNLFNAEQYILDVRHG